MTNYPLWVLQQLVVQEHIGIEEMYDVTIHVFGVALVQTLTKYLHSSSYDCKPIVSMIGGKHSTSSLTPCLFWSRKYCNIGVLIGEFHAWDNCTSIGISVIFYPCKQIKLC